MVDARGYSCPVPVVMEKESIEKNPGADCEILVDSMVCVENITRFGEGKGYKVSYEKQGEDFKIVLKK